MIFGKNAGLMLKYQKAKAKMVEYDVSKQEYPHFPLNSNELSYPTTYGLFRMNLQRRYIQKQNYYTLLQNCICKSVETLDTKSIYKAFVKNGLMDRLQWKLTTKKLLELQK